MTLWGISQESVSVNQRNDMITFALPLLHAKNLDGSSIGPAPVVNGFNTFPSGLWLTTPVANASSFDAETQFDFVLSANWTNLHNPTVTVSCFANLGAGALDFNMMTVYLYGIDNAGEQGPNIMSVGQTPPNAKGDLVFTSTGSTLKAGQRVRFVIEWRMNETSGNPVNGYVAAVRFA